MNGYDERPPFMGGFLAWAGNLPGPVYFGLAVIGAVTGFVYGQSQPHHAQYLYAILGGTAGFVVIPLIALLIRFIIQCILIALLALAVYYAFVKP